MVYDDGLYLVGDNGHKVKVNNFNEKVVVIKDADNDCALEYEDILILTEEGNLYLLEGTDPTDYIYKFESNFYQNFNEFISNKNLSNSLKDIAIVEMHHLAILGKLIKLLGVNPIYKTNEYCHSKNICYTVNIKEMLLERIILDEEKHLECFYYYLNKID